MVIAELVGEEVHIGIGELLGRSYMERGAFGLWKCIYVGQFEHNSQTWNAVVDLENGRLRAFREVRLDG